MMTAGQVALGLNKKDIVINYQASDTLYYYFQKDPMPLLEWSKRVFHFKKLPNEQPEDKSERYFPLDINFEEGPSDCKK